MVSGGCLEGVWRMSEGWMGVCSEWLWVSSQSFGHKYTWSSSKSRIIDIYLFLCPFSKSALRAQKGIKIQKVMLLWPAFFLTKTWWSFRQSDLFLCIGLGLGGHESNFWPCVLCPPLLCIESKQCTLNTWVVWNEYCATRNREYSRVLECHHYYLPTLNTTTLHF